MAAKPLALILGILRPKIDDDEVDNSLKPFFDKIGDGIQDVKIKDLKLSQDQLQFTVVRLHNKFSDSDDTPKDVVDALSQEIEYDLKSAQQSAMGALNAQLGPMENAHCIKIILITECFLVLNTLSSLEKIGPQEKDLFVERLKNAERSCNVELHRLNGMSEICDYLNSKIFPKNPKQADILHFRVGLDKDKLTKDAITMNFYVHRFFHYCHRKVDEDSQGKKWVKKKKKNEKIENEDVLLMEKQVVCIGAALSLVTKDEKLAQQVRNFMTSFDDTVHMKQLSEVKNFLRENERMQTVKRKYQKKRAENEENGKDMDNDQDSALQLFIDLSDSPEIEEGDIEAATKQSRLDRGWTLLRKHWHEAVNRIKMRSASYNVEGQTVTNEHTDEQTHSKDTSDEKS